MRLDRRNFLLSAGLVSINPEKLIISYSKTKEEKAADAFIALVGGKSISYFFLDGALSNEISNALKSWKGYATTGKYYTVGGKVLVPITSKGNQKSQKDVSLISFEQVGGKWVKLPSLNAYQISGLLKLANEVKSDNYAGILLPENTSSSPYRYKTSQGTVEIKTYVFNDNIQNEIKLKLEDKEITRSYLC